MQAQTPIKILNSGIKNDEMDQGGGQTTNLTQLDGDIVFPKIVPREPLTEQFLHFVACLQGTEKCKTAGDHGLSVVRICEAAERSMAESGLAIDIE